MLGLGLNWLTFPGGVWICGKESSPVSEVWGRRCLHLTGDASMYV